MDNQDPNPLDEQGNSREERLGRLLWHYVDRLCAGEQLDREEIRKEHADLADDLLRELETFRSLSTGDGEGPLKRLGDYQLLRRIGRGGMGIVYEAWDVPMDRHVAVKVLPVALVAHSRSVARFVTEARIAGKLQHPNIVPVYSMGIDKGVPYFAMEYVEGETLAAILETRAPEGARTESATTRVSLTDGDLSSCLRTAQLFASAADGLHHAHQKGVVHRDLKPSNLILDTEGRLRILDFGLARLEGTESLTRSRDLIGTPLYMSPEQAEDSKLDHRTDIYSLGAALYEMLCLRPPYRGKNTQDTLSQIVHRDPRSLRESNVLVPRDLDTIVLKCLEKEPRNRYGTAEALAQDLRRFVRGDQIEARPRTRLETWLRRLRRNRSRVAAALVCVLLVLTSSLLLKKHYDDNTLELERKYEKNVLDALLLLQYGQARSPDENTTAVVTADSSATDGIQNVALALEGQAGEGRTDPVVEAVSRLKEARTWLPERPEAIFHLARAQHLLGRDKEAAETIRPLAEGFVPARIWGRVHFEGDAGEPRRELDAPGADWKEAYLLAQRAALAEDWARAIEANSRLIAAWRTAPEPYLGARVEALLARGIARLKARRFDEALEDFATAGGLQLGALEPALLVARTYYRKGQSETASERLQELYDATPFKREAALRIADVHYDFRHYEDALSWADESDESSRREQRRAYCLMRLNRLEDALRAAKGAVALAPRDPRAYLALGHALVSSLPFDSAAFRSSLERTPEEAEAMLHELGPVDEAQAAFRKVLELEPENVEAHNGMAQTFRFLGRFDFAAEWLEKSARLDSDNVVTENTLGIVLSRQGKYDEAVAHFKKVIELEPDAANAHSNLCWAYRQLRRYDDAFRACDKALELDRHLDKPHMITGKIFLLRRDFEEALRRYQKAAEVNPLNHLAFYNQGVVYEMSGRLTEAAAAYQKAIELYSHDIRYFYNLGNVWSQLRDYDRAVEVYRRGLDVKPDHDWTHNNLGIALIEAGDLARAEFHLEKAIFYAPEDPEPRTYLATVREKRNDAQGALAHLDEAIQLFEEIIGQEKKPRGYRALHSEYLVTLERAARLARRAGQKERARTYEEALRAERGSGGEE